MELFKSFYRAVQFVNHQNFSDQGSNLEPQFRPEYPQNCGHCDYDSSQHRKYKEHNNNSKGYWAAGNTVAGNPESGQSSGSFRGLVDNLTGSTSSAGIGREKFKDFSTIADEYTSLVQVTEALRLAGLESSNLIVGIDFTKSNEWAGRHSFHGHSLHHISDVQNPYEQSISIIGRTLSQFDEDKLIPCFGFGDATTHDKEVFSFYADRRPCNGFQEALSRYRELVPHINLAGPTSFAPIIEMAMTIVEQSGGQYHVLLIIADGQVTRSVNTGSGELSPQEQKTIDAIVKASSLPLSIVAVGVGDGPWDLMEQFDDNIPKRSFDNFQFVNFTKIMMSDLDPSKKEAAFALAALMEIPSQYKTILSRRILGHGFGISPRRIPLPPPGETYVPMAQPAQPFQAPSSSDNQNCPICLTNPKNMAFGCGHQTCHDCGQQLSSCPICRSNITI